MTPRPYWRALRIGVAVFAASYVGSCVYYYSKVVDARSFLQSASAVDATITESIVNTTTYRTRQDGKTRTRVSTALVVEYEFLTPEGEVISGRYVADKGSKWESMRAGINGKHLAVLYDKSDPRENLPREVAERRVDLRRVLGNAVLPALMVSVAYLFAAVFFLGYRRQGHAPQ